MDLFKEKMETWQGKLVRLKQNCRTGEHIYPKGLLMRVSCVSNVKVTLQSLPCAACGIIDFMTMKERKKDYAYYFEFVEESELNNADCIPLKIELKGQRYFKQLAEQSDKYREMLQESAISLGFDGIGFKGDRIYAFKGDEAIFIDDGFFKNLDKS